MTAARKTKRAAKASKDPLWLVLVRHGQPGSYEGTDHLGPSLTPLGRRQARKVAKRLAREYFDHIYSSDLRRAVETAEAICRFHPRTPWTVTPLLREVTSHHFVRQADSRKPAIRLRMRKERKALERFARRILRLHRRGQRILVVCHFDVICTLAPVLSGREPLRTIPFGQYHTAVNELMIFPPGRNGWLHLAGCVRHLRPDERT